MQRHVYSDIDALSQAFADFATSTLQQALSRKANASLVIPGGNTPRHYLPALAQRQLAWERITITLSDERWVNTTDEQSNERLAKHYLLDFLPFNTSFIGLKTRHHTPQDAMDEIHQRLDRLPLPVSLTVLGLGDDGHIASLFPGMDPKCLSAHHCVAVEPPIAPSRRISLSLSMLAESEHIALVVAGENKRRLLDRLHDNPDTGLPVTWLLQSSQSPITVFETAM